MAEIELVEQHKSFGGVQYVYKHASQMTGGSMTFAVFIPPQAASGGKLPVLTYLSGLTCTHANVMDKGEYRQAAARHRDGGRDHGGPPTPTYPTARLRRTRALESGCQPADAAVAGCPSATRRPATRSQSVLMT